MYILEVYVTNASLNINRSFTYLSEVEVKAFMRVRIEFNHQAMLGFVSEVSYLNKTKAEIEAMYGYKMLEIIEIVDEKPILSNDLYELALWLSKVTLSPLISCLNVMLPKTFKTSKKLTEASKEIRIKKHFLDVKLTPRQKEVFEMLKDDDLLANARKISVGITNKLIELGLIEKYSCDKRGYDIRLEKDDFKPLTAEQEAVYEGVLNSDKYVNLLYGVTGAGKTEVYLYLAREYLKHDKQVLILVPEIALTPQMINRVKSRFNDVAIYHSVLNDQERHREYMRVLNDEVKIVIGTRSSIFLPFSKLGLIIIDEEHDHSYKQDNTPCYNTKMVAFKRAMDFKAKVLLASATPSLDSYTRALKGDYGFFKLEHRINNTLPTIELVDLNKEVKERGSYIISRRLKAELDNCLNQHKQAIILLNRRGTAPIVKCGNCSNVLMCDSCDVALSYHKDLNELKCHICGKSFKMPKLCPICGSKNILQYGFGTKRVVEELEKLYPEINIGRMDADSTSIKDGHAKILNAFGNHEYDILVGTQMIAKGLDFEDVTLVGILNADAGLMHLDYNSTETTFDLLMQASGRSGRASDKGKVVIQAYNIDHYIFKALMKQSYEMFYRTEMNYRLKANYPPYTHIIALTLKDTSDKRIFDSSEYLYQELKKLPYQVYHPNILVKLKNQNRTRILIKDKNLVSLLNDISIIIDVYIKKGNVSSIKIDVDPVYMD